MFIIHPMGLFRYVWDLFVLFLIIYSCIEVPVILAWDLKLKLSDGNGVIAFLIDIFLLIDIIFNFRTAHLDQYDKLRLIINPKRIAKRFVYLLIYLCIYRKVGKQIKTK